MTATITPIGRAPEPASFTGAALSPRVEALLEAQHALGYLDGERDGFITGARWGAVRWLVAGFTVGALLRHVLGVLA